MQQIIGGKLYDTETADLQIRNEIAELARRGPGRGDEKRVPCLQALDGAALGSAPGVLFPVPGAWGAPTGTIGDALQW